MFELGSKILLEEEAVSLPIGGREGTNVHVVAAVPTNGA